MQGLAVVLFPVVLMLFALGMERVENRLRNLLEPDEEVQQYLDKASNAEVKELTKLRCGGTDAQAPFPWRRAGRRTRQLNPLPTSTWYAAQSTRYVVSVTTLP
jgi:hypothetical protein